MFYFYALWYFYFLMFGNFSVYNSAAFYTAQVVVGSGIRVISPGIGTASHNTDDAYVSKREQGPVYRIKRNVGMFCVYSFIYIIGRRMRGIPKKFSINRGCSIIHLLFLLSSRAYLKI